MQKILFTILAVSFACITMYAQPEPRVSKGKDVAETLTLIKGQWRFVYKIIINEDNNKEEVHYDTRFQPNADQTAMEVAIDTMAIHSFKIDERGRTQYNVNWEGAAGELIVNEWDVSGKWDVKQTPNGIDVHILDAYFPGCPPVIRRIVNINKQQLFLQDTMTGDKYYYKRR